MAPKKASMKFKPKLVKSMKADDIATTDATDEEVARRQRERIQKLQQEQGKEIERKSVLSPSSTTANDSGTVPPRVGGFQIRGSAPVSEMLLGRGNPANQRFSDDTRTLVDFFSGPQVAAVPSTTPLLPANTLYSALVSESTVRDMYAPVTLTTSRNNSGGGGSDYRSGGNSSSHEGRLGNRAELLSEDASPSPSSPAIQDDATAGTSFLRARERELQESYRNNQSFLKNVIEPSTQDARETNESSSSLVWIQLPRFHGVSPIHGGGHPLQDQGKLRDSSAHESTLSPSGIQASSSVPFDLRQLPPGKIGEVKVYRSGRMTMNINGCCFDLLAEASENTGSTGRGGGGGCSLAALTTVETEKDSVYSIPGSVETAPQASCYLLDILQHKLVGVPTIDESSSS